MEGTKGSYWSFILFSLTVACLLLILKLKWSVFANGFCGGSRVLVENEEGLNIWFKHGKKTSSIFVKIKWLKISKYCAHWIMSVFFWTHKTSNRLCFILIGWCKDPFLSPIIYVPLQSISHYSVKTFFWDKNKYQLGM